MSAIDSIARTGLKAALSDLQTTGHNVANAQSVGFKQSYVRLNDLYSTNLAANTQIGIGVQVAGVEQDFTEGASEITSRSLDLSITGQGFFVMRNTTSGQTAYTRAGQFQLDKDGYITQNGERLRGYAAFQNQITTNLVDMQVSNTPVPALQTATVDLEINLDSTATVPANPFSATDPTTYNHRTDNVIYDSLGTPSNLTLYYIKSGSNAWDVQMQINGASVGTGALTFTSGGALNTATGFTGISWTTTNGSNTPQLFDIAFTGSTQFAASNETRSIAQDGYPAGVLTSFDFDKDGMLTARYSNGQSQILSQVAVAKFPAPNGLANIGNTSWIETSESGNAILNSANSRNAINPGTLELSNVDLSQQLINLINAQNYFQANAKVVQTSTQVNQTVIQIQ